MAPMDRRQFLVRSAACLAASTLPLGLARAQAGAPAPKPNILLIVADDLGYHELGIQGCTDVPTPNVDALAKNGVRFTDGYVSCPVCSPTRAGLLTGRYQQRFGHEFNPGPAQAADANFGLSLEEVLLPERLKKAGYATGMFGKWHQGYQPQFHPLKRGFDEYFGFLGGAHSYLDAKEDSANPILRGTDPVAEVTYTTDVFAAEAAAFIERKKDVPFFVYLPFNAVHSPLQALQKYIDRFPAITDPKRQKFAAMLSAMDDGVGTVLAKLRQHNLEENTLIFFISDNGGPTAQTTSGNAPLRGFKGQVLEGGIREPFIIQWKGHLPAGKVYGKPVISLDIHPTALAVAGAAVEPGAKPLDGVNLLPFISGESAAMPHDRLFWRFGEQWAVRMGDWKLLKQPTNAAPQLYNLAQDIGEAKDLAGDQPEKVKALQSAFDAWNTQLMEPRWGKGNARAGKAKAGKAKGQRKAGKAKARKQKAR